MKDRRNSTSPLWSKLVVVVMFMSTLKLTESASDNVTTTISPVTPPTTAPADTTLTPEQECNTAYDDCETCVKITKCYFCESTKNCTYYPYGHIFPKSSVCDMGDIRWGKCWLNFKALVIGLSVAGGILLITTIVCCCCCCRKKKKSKFIQEDAKREREKEERRIRNQERQKERQTKNDEIRKKYGLMKDDHPYQRFDA